MNNSPEYFYRIKFHSNIQSSNQINQPKYQLIESIRGSAYFACLCHRMTKKNQFHFNDGY